MSSSFHDKGVNANDQPFGWAFSLALGAPRTYWKKMEKVDMHLCNVDFHPQVRYRYIPVALLGAQY